MLISAKNPVPVRCPVAGKFNFTQHGEHPFKTRFVELYYTVYQQKEPHKTHHSTFINRLANELYFVSEFLEVLL